MQSATIPTIKKELSHKSHEELLELCLRLSKFKKENKELMSYLLYMEHDRASYTQNIKSQMDEYFEEINKSNFYLIKKSVRKILRYAKKQIRFTLNKEVSIEILLHFCLKLQEIRPAITSNKMLMNIYHRQVDSIKKEIGSLHEDLQYDYQVQLDQIHLHKKDL